ncbi:hypothetical protein H4Q26_004876 [Puccinia striiformis f. sp. tritici PST-130]|nr:hypothetical protein H4Q26_004876 [Puccinia striiformis f. sp. tritici PST-130]
MNQMNNTENLPASMAPMTLISQSSVGIRSYPSSRFQSASPSPAPIRKSRPLQSLNSNLVSRRTFGDENKENYRQDNLCQRPAAMERLLRPSASEAGLPRFIGSLKLSAQLHFESCRLSLPPAHEGLTRSTMKRNPAIKHGCLSSGFYLNHQNGLSVMAARMRR